MSEFDFTKDEKTLSINNKLAVINQIKKIEPIVKFDDVYKKEDLEKITQNEHSKNIINSIMKIVPAYVNVKRKSLTQHNIIPLLKKELPAIIELEKELLPLEIAVVKAVLPNEVQLAEEVASFLLSRNKNRRKF